MLVATFLFTLTLGFFVVVAPFCLPRHLGGFPICTLVSGETPRGDFYLVRYFYERGTPSRRLNVRTRLIASIVVVLYATSSISLAELDLWRTDRAVAPGVSPSFFLSFFIPRFRKQPRFLIGVNKKTKKRKQKKKLSQMNRKRSKTNDG